MTGAILEAMTGGGTHRDERGAVRAVVVVVLCLAVAAVAATAVILTRGKTSTKRSTAARSSPTIAGSGGSGSSFDKSAVPVPATAAFHYGFDLTTQEPDSSGTSPTADTAARSVLSGFRGSFVDEAIYGFGAGADPEPSPGAYDFSSIAQRTALIEATGGTPVITLCSAPDWMKDGATGQGLFDTPPSPDHYEDFATLAAHIAQAFPQVRYFVVWNELKGFWDPATRSWDYQDYTTMYNDVYEAIKAVRPDAMVGGPYANMSAWPTPVRHVVSTVHGAFGYLDQGMLDAVSYWLANNVGADFVAVDGATENGKSGEPLTDAVTAAGQYAAVDAWIRSQTDLPIWWMESHIQPATGWTEEQGAAARVASLAEMASSGAAVGMQWQPQDQSGWPDEGLWTSTLMLGGGQPTPLAWSLEEALPVLEDGPVLTPGQPAGVLVATDRAGTVAVDTTAAPTTVELDGTAVPLSAGQVLVR